MIDFQGVARFYKVSFEQYAKGARSAYKNVDESLLLKEYENIKLPARATSGSAGYDFYLPRDIEIKQDNYILIPTGIRAEIENGWALMLFPRSGLGFQYGFRLLNTTGIIDSDYFHADNEGHILAKAAIESKESLKLKAQERFMQGVFLPYGKTYDDKPVTHRRVGGFGSTDKAKR